MPLREAPVDQLRDREAVRLLFGLSEGPDEEADVGAGAAAVVGLERSVSERTCANCGTPEERKRDARGRNVVNLDPLSGLCLVCILARAAGTKAFHSRREDRKGEVVDTKARAARNDE